MMVARSRRGHTMLRTLLSGMVDVDSFADVAIGGIATDSRRVKRGDLFCALSGARAQGHEFIAQALTAGAAAIVWEKTPGIASIDEAKIAHGKRHGVPLIAVEDLRGHLGAIAARFYGEPSTKMVVYGVTGTNGKTSCSHFIARALSADGPCGIIGTIGLGLIDQLETATHTTPDAVSVHASLAQMHAAGAKAVAMEVSSHGLDQGRVNGVCFGCAVFTNLSRDHLDYHHDMDAYGAAKARLFFRPGLRHAVINADDEFGRWLLSNVPSYLNVVSYGLSGDRHEPRPTLYAERVELLPQGLRLQVNTPWGAGELNSALLGRFNASNLLAVLGALLVTGIPFDIAVQRVQRLQTVSGRMERYGGGTRPLVVVDYAHSPDALKHVLQALREHCRGRLVCVFGCGGDRDRGKRPLMGAIAQDYADAVVVTDDNPRTEDARQIVQDILGGMRATQSATVIHDRAAAIAHAVQRATRDDVVLIAGKGHEMYQIVGEQKFAFNDGEHVQTLLAEDAR